MTIIEYLKAHQKNVLLEMIHYIPQDVKDETDDLNDLVKRILHNALSNPNLNKDAKFTGGDTEMAFALLVYSGGVSLRKPQTATHARIMDDGEIKQVRSIVPPVLVRWELTEDKLNVIARFPTDTENVLIQSYSLK